MDTFTNDFRYKNKPLYADKNFEIYLLASKVNLGLVNHKYSPYNLYLINLTNQPIKAEIAIHNLIPRNEAVRKLNRIAAARSAEAMRRANAGAWNGGLVGLAVSYASGSEAKSILYSQNRSVDFLNNNLMNDSKEIFEIELEAAKDNKSLFLIKKQLAYKDKPALQPSLTVCYKLTDKDRNCFSQGIDEGIGQSLIVNKNFHNLAYIDSKLSEKLNKGIYITAKSSTQSKTRVSSTAASDNASPVEILEPLAIVPTKLKEREEKLSPKSKSTKLIEFIPVAHSANIFNNKINELRIFQNVRSQPSPTFLEVIKFTPDEKAGYRKLSGVKYSIMTKDISAGIVQITNVQKLPSGEYGVIDRNNNLVYDFAIPKPVSSKKK